MRRFGNYDEINDVGNVCFTGCRPLDKGGIEVTVAEAWDDTDNRRHILLTCNGGIAGVEYSMDVDKAEALGLLLCAAARGMREMAKKIDEDEGE